MRSEPVTFCVDVGSIPGGKFAWARIDGDGWATDEGPESPESLRQRLIDDLADGRGVSIGFEAPLFLPLRVDPSKLTTKRAPWELLPFSAGAGTGVLVTGLMQAAWVLGAVGWDVTTSPALASGRLLVWEAFVSGSETTDTRRPTCPGGVHGPHACDALVAASEAHRWRTGLALQYGAARIASSMIQTETELGLDLIAAVTGKTAIVADSATWDATIIQLPKPVHSPGEAQAPVASAPPVTASDRRPEIGPVGAETTGEHAPPTPGSDPHSETIVTEHRPTRVLGAGLCDAGWVGVLLETGGSPEVLVAESIADLVSRAGPVDVAGVDLPIGLGVDRPRAADEDARFLVRDHRWLVTPIREALLASSHAEGSEINRRVTGRGITEQAFALRHKIFEVEQWLRTATPEVREVRAEVSFGLMLDGPPPHPKYSFAGIGERSAALREHGIILGPMGTSVSGAGIRDVLAAGAAAWTALRIAEGTAGSFPSPPEQIDGWPRPVAIWT